MADRKRLYMTTQLRYGDGHDDFLVSSYLNDEAADTAGQVYLILGKTSGWAMDTTA